MGDADPIFFVAEHFESGIDTLPIDLTAGDASASFLNALA
jgi:hypothetical protein